jgi:ATP-dependent DNA helicase RecQ
LYENPEKYSVVHQTDNGGSKSPGDPSEAVPIPEQNGMKRSAPHLNAGTTNYEQKLFVELRTLCQSIAEQSHVAPFMVFTYKSLKEMAHYRPCDLKSFRNIEGVGGRKLEKYGLIFTSAIKSFCHENGIEIPQPDISKDSEPGNTLEQIYHFTKEISSLNNKVKELTFQKNELLDQVKKSGIHQQGNYILQSSTTSIRQLNLEAFKQLYPQVFMEIGSVTLTDADKILGRDEVTELCTLKESTKYSVKEIKSDSEIQENPNE